MTEKKNPFPRKSVVSLDSAIALPLYTLVTPQVERAGQFAVDYLEDGIGQIITVQGPYGSGKSHLINFAINRVQQAYDNMSAKVRFVKIYQKASSADFVALYKELIHQIGYPLLQEVNDRFLGNIALREMTAEMEKSKNALLELLPEEKKEQVEVDYDLSKKQMLERLRADPKTVYNYLDNLIIQPEAVYDRRASELLEIAGENFKKAFFYLPDVRLGKVAYKWFVMDEMTDIELERLGVSSRLTSAIDAKYALSLLVTLFRHADIRLLMYLDQIEKLLIGTDDKTLDENRGVLQTLAEICPREKAFLALVGAEDGWDLMRREDFWSRVGSTKLQLGMIPPEWGRALIKVYSREKEAYTPKTKTAESDIAPFNFAAADEILRISNGNIRVFLQICHDVFKKYATGGTQTIDPAVVNEVVGTQFDEASVSAEIQRILRKQGFHFELQSQLKGNFRPDILIGDTANPLAVIEISNSLYYVDEAENALNILNYRTDLNRQHPNTQFIVVIIGYASAEVAQQLDQIVDSYLVYDGQAFARNFEAVLNSLSPNGRQLLSADAEIASSAKDGLQDLLAAREKEISDLTEKLQALSQKQTEPSPRHQEWRSWLRADQEKWEQRQREIEAKAEEERTQLQRVGERTRWRKLAMRSAIFLVAIVLGFYPMLRITNLLWLLLADSRWFPSTLELGTLVLYLVLALFFYYWGIYLKLSPLGFNTSEIGNYTGDLGQLILRAKTTRVSGLQAYRCLKNPNPVIRYFGALTFLTTDGETHHETEAAVEGAETPKRTNGSLRLEWSHLAATEGWKPLYLAFLKMAFRTQDLATIQDHLTLLLEANMEDPRIIYLLSMLPRQYRGKLDMSITGLNAASPASEKVFAHALFERVLGFGGTWQDSRASQQPLARFAQSFVQFRSTPLDELTIWYHERGQFWYGDLERPVRLQLAEDELRSIVNALSPHREHGLASFQDLPGSNFYLRLYRFFAEIEWRFDQGDVALRQ